MRGRKKVELTQSDVIIREKSKERISDFIESCQKSKMSLAEIAEKIGISEGSLRHYQKGRSYISVFTAKLFEDSTGFICEYWLGLADEYVKVSERVEELANIYPEEWSAYDSSYDTQLLEEKDYIVFFEKCGFKYKNLSLHPCAYEFSGLSGDGSSQPHQIESCSQNTIRRLTDEELSDLISKVHDLIEFECYKITKERERAK